MEQGGTDETGNQQTERVDDLTFLQIINTPFAQAMLLHDLSGVEEMKFLARMREQELNLQKNLPAKTSVRFNPVYGDCETNQFVSLN